MQKLNKDEWRIAIATCREGNHPVRTWCSEHDLSHKAFYYWEKRFRDDNENVVPIPVSEWVSISPMSNNRREEHPSRSQYYNPSGRCLY